MCSLSGWRSVNSMQIANDDDDEDVFNLHKRTLYLHKHTYKNTYTHKNTHTNTYTQTPYLTAAK